MKLIYLIVVCLFVLLQQVAFADKYAAFTLAKVGMNAPDFTCKTISGKTFTLK